MVRYTEGSDLIYSLLKTSLTLYLQEDDLTAQTYGLLIRYSRKITSTRIRKKKLKVYNKNNKIIKRS